MIWNPKLSKEENARLTRYAVENANHLTFSLHLSGLQRAFKRYVDSDIYENEDQIAQLALGFFDAHYRIVRYLGTNSDDELKIMPEWIEANVLGPLNLDHEEKSSIARKMSREIALGVYRNI